jgi:hypothetical protein
MLVNDIASAAPSMAWLPVPNPGPASLTLDYSKPFNIIAQYIGGNIAPPAGIQFWNPAEDLQYVFRTLLIGAFGFVAAVTVIIMEGAVDPENRDFCRAEFCAHRDLSQKIRMANAINDLVSGVGWIIIACDFKTKAAMDDNRRFLIFSVCSVKSTNIAQPADKLICNQQVIGSNLIAGSSSYQSHFADDWTPSKTDYLPSFATF